ncbi:hypothetical protein [Mameliella sediminis]|uniref:hypothetical protein n=1 Tax=Mameliella sediminis TaxID=2836866 RepID=UPI001C455D3F|nr:hypothetical protein [Mameliella sediminis]MBV7394577.1 hypothetical protein [Mameliella sediminis]
MFARIAGAAILALSLTACVPSTVVSKTPITGKQLTTIQDTVAEKLKDPRSAQFRDVFQIVRRYENGKMETYVCGEVNGKNSFGGYVGFTYFKGHFVGKSFRVDDIATPDSNWLLEMHCPV